MLSDLLLTYENGWHGGLDLVVVCRAQNDDNAYMLPTSYLHARDTTLPTQTSSNLKWPPCSSRCKRDFNYCKVVNIHLSLYFVASQPAYNNLSIPFVLHLFFIHGKTVVNCVMLPLDYLD